MEHGADVDATREGRHTALHLASSLGGTDAIRALTVKLMQVCVSRTAVSPATQRQLKGISQY